MTTNNPARTLNRVVLVLVVSLVILTAVTIGINLSQQRLGSEELLESGQIEIPEEYRYGDARDQVEYRIWHNQTTDDLILEVQTASYPDAVGDRTVSHRPLILPGRGSEPQAYGTRRYGYLGKLVNYNGEVYSVTTDNDHCYVAFSTRSYGHHDARLAFNNYDKFFSYAPDVRSIQFGEPEQVDRSQIKDPSPEPAPTPPPLDSSLALYDKDPD